MLVIQDHKIHGPKKENIDRQRQSNQESSPFERQLLTLLSNQTLDLTANALAFFSSLGTILSSFDIEQKLEFWSSAARSNDK